MTYRTSKWETLVLAALLGCGGTEHEGSGGSDARAGDDAADNVAPMAAFVADVVGRTVTVDASNSTDTDGTIVQYQWDFGDGFTSTGIAPAPHKYPTAGTALETITITLTVVDDGGATDDVSESVTLGARASEPGAHLPIDYDLSSVVGTVLFVATDGDDDGPGTETAPLQTVAEALSQIGSGESATVVIRGGEYLEANLQIPPQRQVRMIAYPGELPTFCGSQTMEAGWTPPGDGLAWHSYVSQPVTDGSGISFTTGQNLTGNMVGKHPDQVWIGTTELRQVLSKDEVVNGSFWVDSVNDRLFLTAVDAAKPNIEASDKARFIRILGQNTSLEGLRITRYSNSANNYGVVLFEEPAHGTLLRNVEIIDAAFQTVVYVGRPDNILLGARMENVTIQSPNWMGATAGYVDDLVFDRVKIVGADPWNEFTLAPQSGALKTSRCRRIRILNSEFLNNNSHGLWFDQSNVDVHVAGSRIVNNLGSGVFFEISDSLLLIDSYIWGRPAGISPPVKLAGSSGLRLVNNTIGGGPDPIGIYTDGRSKPGCSDPSQPLCGPYASDRDTARTLPATLDWMPRLDLLLNNIIAHPSSNGLCGMTTSICFLSANASAGQPIEEIVHHADAERGIPETRMDGNVYANGSSPVIVTEDGNYTTAAAWSGAAAGSPISITGLDANSRTGDSFVNADGSPTGQLDHATAIPIPTDAAINAYLPAGTKHYGVVD